MNTVSWRNETTPNLTEMNPRVIFHRLFGDGGDSAQRLMQMKKTDSILDSVTREVNGLAANLGSGDRSKLNEYMDSVRDIEQRIQIAEGRSKEAVDLPGRPDGIPEAFEEHVKLMFDLQAIAFRADITRVFSMIMARESSPRTYPNIGVPEQHHPMSHHRNDPEIIAKKAKIDTYQSCVHPEKLGDSTGLRKCLIDRRGLFGPSRAAFEQKTRIWLTSVLGLAASTGIVYCLPR